MTISPDTTRGLQFALLGSVFHPEDEGWDDARAAWNLAVDQRPAAVVVAADAADIAQTMRFARQTGLRVLAQSTGHLASAVGDLSDTVLIRTAHMQGVEVFADTRTARVEAGVTWGRVNDALANTGLAALAGSSPDVGVVGYTLGGGYGWLARSRGLAASSVTAIELVLADGRHLRATDSEHAELFWALRGGGGNFGIVTAIEFRVYPIADVYAGMLLFPIARVREVLTAYASWTSDLDESVTTCARILRFPPLPELPDFLRGRSFVGVDGAIDAPDTRARELLSPLRALSPEIDTFTRIPATELSSIHLDPPAPVPVVGDGLILDELDEAAIDALLASAAGAEGSSLLVVDLRHLGGALGRPSSSAGAVGGLAGSYLLYTAGIAPTPETTQAIGVEVASVRAAMMPWMSELDYSNFREVGTSPERFWRTEVLERLRSVKTIVDPDDVVRSAHPLRIASGTPRSRD